MNEIDEAQQQIQDILNKYNLKIDYQMKFPSPADMTNEVKLALMVLAKSQMKMVVFLNKK